jgi:hypothetical protein
LYEYRKKRKEEKLLQKIKKEIDIIDSEFKLGRING